MITSTRYPLVLLVLCALIATHTGLSAARAEAAMPKQLPVAPNWGACGLFTAETKVVRKYRYNYVLQCGGPRLSSDPQWGY